MMSDEIEHIRSILKSGNQNDILPKVIWNLFKQNRRQEFIDVMKSLENEELKMITRIMVKNESYEPSKAIEQLLHSRGIAKSVIINGNDELNSENTSN